MVKISAFRGCRVSTCQLRPALSSALSLTSVSSSLPIESSGSISFDSLPSHLSSLQASEPILYIYAITMNSCTQYGVISALSIDDYFNNKIIPNSIEFIEENKQEINSESNTGPLFLVYENCNRVDAITQIVTSKGSWADKVTKDNVRHSIWKCSIEESKELVEAFNDISFSYIVDGHYRAKQAIELCGLRESEKFGGKDEIFLGIFIADDQIREMDFKGVLKGLNEVMSQRVIEEIGKDFQVFLVNGVKKVIEEEGTGESVIFSESLEPFGEYEAFLTIFGCSFILRNRIGKNN